MAGREAKATVILVHGWTLNHRSWNKVAQLLDADGDLRVITYDQRGHGASSFDDKRERAENETIETLAHDLATVIDQCVPAESPVILAGHSMGGMAIIEFAAYHAELLAERVRGVVLIGASTGDVAAVRVPGEQVLLRVADYLPLRPRRLVPARAEEVLAFGEGGTVGDARDVAAQTGNTPLATTGAFYEAVRDLDTRSMLPALNAVPVRVLVGALDRLTPPRHAKVIADGVESARLEIIPGVGHLVIYEAPRRVRDIVHEMALTSA